MHFHHISTFSCCSDEMEDIPDGFQDCFLEWCSRRGSVCRTTTRFETHDRESHVCRLKKSLYGLKQAPRTWYDIIDSFLSSLGFTKSKEDSNLYYKVEDGNPVMLLLYVDMFVTGMDGLIADTKRKLASEFEMKDLGMMHYFLGMEVWKNADGISLGQGKYTVDILKRFGMMDYKAMTTPMVSNLKLLGDASSEVVDAMMYC